MRGTQTEYNLYSLWVMECEDINHWFFFFYFLSQIKEVWVKEKLFEEDWQPDGCLLFSSIQGCISGEYKLRIKFYLII